MPEGPEVRRYALQLADALDGREIVAFSARTKLARAFLEANPNKFAGRHIEKVRSHGKHVFGLFEGGFGFHCHLMMWGRWFVMERQNSAAQSLAQQADQRPAFEFTFDENGEPVRDRRERARIVTPSHIAILFSAPVFEIFEGDPYEQIENLATLGPDILPYDGAFDAKEFRRRLSAHPAHEIGAVLLDQRVCAGIGNYLRAEILFFCRISPWMRVADLDSEQLDCLSAQIPLVASRALREAGVSIPPEMRERLLREPALSYNENIREWGARHAVFRRTNLPCLECGTPIRQKKQVVYKSDDGDEANDKARPIFFCPNCQNVPVAPARPSKPRTKSPSSG